MTVSVQIFKRESSTSFVHKTQQFNTFTYVHPFHIFSQIHNVTGSLCGRPHDNIPPLQNKQSDASSRTTAIF